MTLKTYVLFLLILLLAGAIPASAAPSEPLEQVRQTVDAVIGLLRDKSLDREIRREKLSSLIRGRFEFAVMSQWTLGKNWRIATEEEKRRFQELFADLLEATYLSRIESYTDETVRYVSEQIKDRRAEVETVIATDKTDIPIRYKLIREGDQWLVYDVVIEEVSLVRNYRSSYDEIIRKEGMNGLLARMEEKIRELRQNKGEKQG